MLGQTYCLNSQIKSSIICLRREEFFLNAVAYQQPQRVPSGFASQNKSEYN